MKIVAYKNDECIGIVYDEELCAIPSVEHACLTVE